MPALQAPQKRMHHSEDSRRHPRNDGPMLPRFQEEMKSDFSSQRNHFDRNDNADGYTQLGSKPQN